MVYGRRNSFRSLNLETDHIVDTLSQEPRYRKNHAMQERETADEVLPQGTEWKNRSGES